MLTLADAWSPSRSVIVATTRTRLSADKVAGWSSDPHPGSCWIARIWSSVTSPAASIVTVNTRSLLIAVRPWTTPPTSDRITFSPVATSTSPDEPAVTASA